MKVEKVLLGAGKRLSLSGWMYRKAKGLGREGVGRGQQRWWQIHTQHMIYLSKKCNEIRQGICIGLTSVLCVYVMVA